MVRKIVSDEEALKIKCNDVDVTFENGLYHSCLKPDSGLIKDLVDTIGHYRKYPSVLTANQIGYFGNAMVIKDQNACVPILNPSVICKTGGRKKDHKLNVKYFKEIKLSFWGVDGKKYALMFKGGYSIMIQEGLKRLAAGVSGAPGLRNS